MLVYIIWRASSVPVLASRVSRRGLVAISVFIMALFLVGRVVGHGTSGAVGAALERTGMFLLVTGFLTTFCLFVVDIFTAFGFLFKKSVPVLRGWALVAGGLLTAVALVQGMRAPEVVSYEVTMPGLPQELDGTVVVALADMHLGSIHGEAWFDKRMAEVEALQPDLVLFLGDTFEGHGDLPEGLPTLAGLKFPLGKWSVDGNHESHGGPRHSPDILEQAGVQRLENRWVEPAHGLILAGVEDLTTLRRSGLVGDPVREALANRPKGATILLSHTPWGAEKAALAGVDLMLSGHTHGGQIWPFGYFVQRDYPLLAGLYNVDGMTVLVSRGTGSWGTPMRLWHRAEILRITLRAAPARDGRST